MKNNPLQKTLIIIDEPARSLFDYLSAEKTDEISYLFAEPLKNYLDCSEPGFEHTSLVLAFSPYVLEIFQPWEDISSRLRTSVVRLPLPEIGFALRLAKLYIREFIEPEYECILEENPYFPFEEDLLKSIFVLMQAYTSRLMGLKTKVFSIREYIIALAYAFKYALDENRYLSYDDIYNILRKIDELNRYRYVIKLRNIHFDLEEEKILSEYSFNEASAKILRYMIRVPTWHLFDEIFLKVREDKSTVTTCLEKLAKRGAIEARDCIVLFLKDTDDLDLLKKEIKRFFSLRNYIIRDKKIPPLCEAGLG